MSSFFKKTISGLSKTRIKLSNLFATHPPIDERIRAIGGAFDENLTLVKESELDSGQISMDESQSLVSSFSDPSTHTSDPQKGSFHEEDLNQIGQIMADQVIVAQRIISEIDESLVSLIHQKSGAHAIVYSLLLSENDQVRENQLNVIKGSCEDDVSKTLKAISDQFKGMHSTEKKVTEKETPRIISKNLAELKANKVSEKKPDKLVLGADSVIDLHGELISKPTNRDEAFSILKKLNGQKHQLISSVCISKNGSMIWNSTDAATLTMKQLNSDEIKSYLKKIRDKELYAYGVYQIEADGRSLFSKIEGDEDTIMGLPVKQIKEYLNTIK